MVRRPPYAAGRFYMGNDASLEREIKGCLSAPLEEARERVKALGAIVPHAGYEYSGGVACDVYTKVEIPPSVVIVGPNHAGLGEPLALSRDGSWSTPFGDVAIDSELAGKILAASKVLKADPEAHLYEHSIEVQLPFLQYISPHDFQFVPISMREYGREDCEDIGISIAQAIRDFDKSVLIVASTDFTHYEPQAEAEKKDKLAIDAILKMDPEKLFDVVIEHEISMCGPGPVAATLYACRELEAHQAELIKYQTSGDRTGDYDQVVGYAGIIIK